VDRWQRLDETISQVEQTLLVILLSSMIFVAFSQIVLRNLLATGLTWGDALVRNLVLWVGFIGAALATKEGNHINIDVVSRWMPSLGKTIMAGITHLFSFLICGLMTFASLKFIKNEVQMGNVAFLGIPSWIPEIILPIIFVLMAFRFGLRSIQSFFINSKIENTHDQERMT
jgi:TRAP-type C4-dicarboxylate transport system permease small subunit